MRDLTSRVRDDKIESKQNISVPSNMYVVGLKRADGTVIQAVVKADNKKAAKVRAIENAVRMVKAGKEQEKENISVFGIEEGANILPKMDGKLKPISVKGFEICGCEDGFGYENHKVMLFTEEDLYLTNCNMVNDFTTAYTEALAGFHRKKMVEGFLYRVAQPCTVNKNEKHILEYFYSDIYSHDVEENIYSNIKLEQCKNFSVIDLGLSYTSLRYIGPNMTIQDMLNILVPEGSIEAKILYLLYLKSEIEDYDNWKSVNLRIGEVEVNDWVSEVDVNDWVSEVEEWGIECFSSYEKYINYYETGFGINDTKFIVLSEENNVDVVLDCSKDRKKYERSKAFTKANCEMADKLGDFYTDYYALLSDMQKKNLEHMMSDLGGLSISILSYNYFIFKDLKAFIKAKFEIADKLGDLYFEYYDLLSDIQKENITNMMSDLWGVSIGLVVKYITFKCDDNKTPTESVVMDDHQIPSDTLGMGDDDDEDDGWGSISASDDGWGSSSGFSDSNDSDFGSGFGEGFGCCGGFIKDTSVDTEAPTPTKPSKSTKPKSKQSNGTKGKKAGK